VTRILLVCPEPLGHGQPAGVGIRFLEIARVLRADGHDLTVLSPDAGLVEGCRSGYINPPSIVEHTAANDMAIVQGHVANGYFMDASPIPTVVDLYDPFIVENLHYYGERGAGVFTHDHMTLMNSLVRGDFFLCASEAQRFFYLGALIAAGRLNPAIFESDPRAQSLIAIAPFGVHEPRAVATRDRDKPEILFGGIYDWYDPICAIEAIAIACEAVPGITLTFTTHPNPEITPQGKLGEAIAHCQKHRYEFVKFEPWVAYQRRAEFFDRFALALLTFPRSLETDLSMRTRVYDYLWCGLPVVSSSAPGTDEILHRYHAGRVIANDSPAAFANEVIALLLAHETYYSMVRGTQHFVAEHQWARTLAPLREFCRAPKSDATKETFAAAPAIPDQRRSILHRIRRRLRS
jgi:glycosyltransferase involved in cell wall biosynthesis